MQKRVMQAERRANVKVPERERTCHGGSPGKATETRTHRVRRAQRGRQKPGWIRSCKLDGSLGFVCYIDPSERVKQETVTI